MAKLETDTRFEGKEGTYIAQLHEDWQVWFPNGGYMAALLLRCAAAVSRFPAPIHQTSCFLKVPKLGAVDIVVQSERATKHAEALSYRMTQDGQVIITGLCWFGQEVPGYVHDDATMPDVPHWSTLAPTTAIEGAHPGEGLWNNFEQRPVTGDMHWQQTVAGEPVQRDWLRFEPENEPALNAGRMVVLLDAYGWPAAARAHSGDGRYIAPTLSLSINFHRPCAEPWLLSEATSPIASGGYMQISSRLWAEQGGLVASAQGTLMCRPRPGFDG